MNGIDNEGKDKVRTKTTEIQGKQELQAEAVAGRGNPFQGPKLGSCVTLGNELSEETHVWTKQEILLEKSARAENSAIREPRRTALPCGLQSWVYGDGISFRVVFKQPF